MIMKKEKLMDSSAAVPTFAADIPPVLTEEVVAAVVFVVLYVVGRGGRGKSTALRWLIDHLRSLGITVVIADGDRTNPTLRAYYPDARSPASPDDATVGKWKYDLLEERAAAPGFAVLAYDFGGGDQTVKKISYEVPLVDMLTEDLRARPVVLHFVGNDLDDLAYVRDCEKDSRFAPPCTAVILNEGIIPEHLSFDEVNASVENSDVVNAIKNRGGEYLFMPTLKPANEINEKRATFADILAGKAPLGPVSRRMTRTWDERMQKCFAPVLAWILQ